MAELTRFRMLRNPSPDCGSSPRATTESGPRPSAILTALLDAVNSGVGRGEVFAAKLTAIVSAARETGELDTEGDHTVRASRSIDALTDWLACHPTSEAADVRRWLTGLLKKQDFGDLAPADVFKAVVKVGDWPLFVSLLQNQLLLLLTEASAAALNSNSRVVAPNLASAISHIVAKLRVSSVVQEFSSKAQGPRPHRLTEGASLRLTEVTTGKGVILLTSIFRSGRTVIFVPGC